MNVMRLLIGAVFGIFITVILFFIMPLLIEIADKKLDETEARKIVDIHMPDVELSANLKEVKPKKPDDPEEPPPDLEQPDIEDVDINPDALNVSPNVSTDVNIGLVGITGADGEYLPIVKVAPLYPRRANTRGIEGYCTVEYTVTTSGSVSDPVAIDCQPKGYFERASVKAALKFKYKPRVIDGEAIQVPGVQNRFTYTLED